MKRKKLKICSSTDESTDQENSETNRQISSKPLNEKHATTKVIFTDLIKGTASVESDAKKLKANPSEKENVSQNNHLPKTTGLILPEDQINPLEQNNTNNQNDCNFKPSFFS
jgi:hypothetical protein